MKFRKTIWMALIIAVFLSACTLGATPAPTQDPGAIQTQAFSLVMTQSSMGQTQTALAVPPTNTPQPSPTVGAPPTFAPIGGTAIASPLAFNTQQPGLTPLASALPTVGVVATVSTKNGCNDGTYNGETAPYDGAEFWPGEEIVKAFTIFNSGTCAWDEGYAFVWMSEYSSPEFAADSTIKITKDPSEHTAPGHSQSFVLHLKAPKEAGEYTAYWKLRDDGGNYFGPLVFLKIKVLPYSQKKN